MLISALPSSWCYLSRLCNLQRAFKIPAECESQLLTYPRAYHMLGTLLKCSEQETFTGGLLLCLPSYKCLSQMSPFNLHNNLSRENYHHSMTQMMNWAQKG